jgi:hypothetical protein
MLKVITAATKVNDMQEVKEITAAPSLRFIHQGSIVGPPAFVLLTPAVRAVAVQHLTPSRRSGAIIRATRGTHLRLRDFELFSI